MDVCFKSLIFFLTVLFVQANHEDNSLRLVSQTRSITSQTAGRLEVFIDSQWGTVCDDSFTITDANVACRQLGFSNGAIALNNAGSLGYGSTGSPIWLDNLGCSSSDTVLVECDHNGIGEHNCVHSEDVILSCLAEGSVRLATTSFSNSGILSPSGRLEIYINDEWGTVCDDLFTITGANVVCKQLGFSAAERWTYIGAQNSFPGASGRDILLDDVECRSTDTSLLSCPRNRVGAHNCVHLEDVVIFCDSSLPIINGGSSSTGAIIGGVVGSVFIFMFLCIPATFCIVFAISASSSGRGRNRRAAPRSHTVANTTNSTRPRNIFVHSPAQQPPPPNPANQQNHGFPQQVPPPNPADQQNKYPPITGVLQEAPPPSYDAAVAYPPPSYPTKPYGQPPQQTTPYPQQPAIYPVPNEPHPPQPQGVVSPLQNQPPSSSPQPQDFVYPPQNQPPQPPGFIQQLPDAQAQLPFAPYPASPAYPPPVGSVNPSSSYPDTQAPSAPPM